MTNRHAVTRLVVLASGAGSTMRAVLEAASDDAYGATVVGVVTDKPGVGALDIAAEAGVATAVVSPKDYADRAAWDEGLADAVAGFAPDLVLCLGFMRIIGAPTLERFEGRIVNTHPALLPSFPGAHGVRDALAHGVKVTGCTVMLVDAGVDTGPILAQHTVQVWEDDTEETLHERIKIAERALVAETVGRMARDGWTVDGRRARIGA